MRTPIMSPIRRMKPGSVRHVAHQPGDNLRGAVLMTISMLTFVSNDTVIKFIMQAMPMSQAIVIRGAFVLMGIAIIAPKLGGLRLVIPRDARGPMAIRTVAEIGSTVLFLLALHNMAIGDLSAIMQGLPLVVMVAAALFFGEHLGWRRLSAVGVGMVGVLLILRPGTSAFGIWSVVAIGAMVLIAARDIATRYFSAEVSSATIAFYAAGFVTIYGVVMSPFEGWIAPNLSQVLLLALSSVFLTFGYITAVAAMRVGEVSYVAPFRYTSLLGSILAGLVVFGEWPDLWTWLGAALVVAAGLYTIWREAKLGKVH